MLRRAGPFLNEAGGGEGAGPAGAGGSPQGAASSETKPTAPTAPIPSAEPSKVPAKVVVRRSSEPPKVVSAAERKGLAAELDSVRRDAELTKKVATETSDELQKERWDRALNDAKVLPEYRKHVRDELLAANPKFDPKSDAGKAAIDAYVDKRPAFKAPEAPIADPVSEWVKQATPKDGKPGLPADVVRDIVSNLVR